MGEDDRPEQSREQLLQLQHSRLGGAASDDGVRYEWLWAALLYLRCLNSRQIAQFRLAANVKGALPLDDLVLSFTTTENPHIWYSLFIQLKYRQSEQSKLVLQQLTGKKGDFAFLTYLMGITNINNSTTNTQNKPDNISGNKVLFSTPFANCFFLLCTNAKANTVVVDCSKPPQNPAMNVINYLFHSETSNIFVIDHSSESMDEVTAKFVSNMKAEVERETNDEEIIKAFHERLFVGSGMPSVRQLEEMIKREMMAASLKRETSLSTCLNSAYISYEKVFSEWSKAKRGLVLNDTSNNKLDQALEQINHELNKMNSLLLPVNFVDNPGVDIDITDGVSVVNVVSTGKSIKLSFTKVVRLLEKIRQLFVAYNIKDLLHIQDSELSSWESQSNTVLLIAIEAECKELKVVCDKVSKILHKTKNQKRKHKVMFVSMQNHDVVQNIVQASFPHCKQVNEMFKFNQLDEETKIRVMETEISFLHVEGKLPFKSLCLVDDLEKILTESIVDELLTSDAITIGPYLGDVVDYYIPRTLNMFYTNAYDKAILKATDLLVDVLVVGGMTAEQREKWAPHGKDFSIENCDKYRVLVGKISEIERSELQSLGYHKKNYHYFEMKHDEVLQVQWSSGNTAEIHRYLKNNEYRCYQVDSTFKMTYRKNLVIAEPGMGKTFLLDYLARNFQSTMTKPHWIVRVNLGDHVYLLHEMKRATSSESQLSSVQVLEFLAAASGIAKDSLEFALFRISLETSGNVVVLLDGFDEIAQSFLEEGERLLKGVLDSKATRVWVTARHSVKSELERILDTGCFTVKPFSEDDVKEFFRKFWSFKLSAKERAISPGELDACIGQVSKLVSESLGETGKSLLGIPLQCMLVAEAFYNHVDKPDSHPLPDKINLLYLFEMFLERKFEISFLKKYPGILASNVKYDYYVLKDKSLKDLTRAAMILLITRDDLEKLGLQDKIYNKTRTFFDFIMLSMDKTGVVYNVINNQPIFVHRTFAEYLVALFFASKYKQYREFLRTFLFHPHNVVVRSMFDRMLSKGHPVHEAILDNNSRRVEELLADGADIESLDAGGRSPLNIAAHQMLQPSMSKPRSKHMIQVLLERGARHDSKDDVFEWIPLEFAIKTNAFDAIEHILVSQADFDNPVGRQNTRLWNRYVEIQVNIEVVKTFTNLLNVELPDVFNDGDRFTLKDLGSKSCELHVTSTAPGGNDRAQHRYWINLFYALYNVA